MYYVGPTLQYTLSMHFVERQTKFAGNRYTEQRCVETEAMDQCSRGDCTCRVQVVC